ncbi:hypothetical protein [Chitinophaga sp.]|uniref:hypothetical protein n=1 Tax=Chitinophaga sp. TaxID=1869181 RepID=UPI0031E2F374
MKRAKLILAAVAVLAIAGGTLAFKATSRGTQVYYTTNAFNAIAPAANSVANAYITTTGTNRKYWTIEPGTEAVEYNTIATGL